MLTHFFVYSLYLCIPIDGKELWKRPFKNSSRHSNAMVLFRWESSTFFSIWRRTRVFKSEEQPRTRGSSLSFASQLDGSPIFGVSSPASLFFFLFHVTSSFPTTPSSDATTFSSTLRGSSTKTSLVSPTQPRSSSTAVPPSTSSSLNKRRKSAIWTSLSFRSQMP